MTVFGPALAWLHRNWVFRFMEPAYVPALLLIHSAGLAEDVMPGWLTVALLGLLAALFLGSFVGGHLHRIRRPRRDWSRPVLEQVQNDSREDVPMEERAGLRRIPQPAPPAPAVAFIRLVGRRAPTLAEGFLALAWFGLLALVTANTVLARDLSLDAVLVNWGLQPIGLSRWELALIMISTLLLVSIRQWCAGRRAEFDGEEDARPVEAYG